MDGSYESKFENVAFSFSYHTCDSMLKITFCKESWIIQAELKDLVNNFFRSIAI